MILFAFDRDLTVDSSPDPGPVPLAWVRWLRRAGHCVWAVGNPALGPEADIPTHRDIARLVKADARLEEQLRGVDRAHLDKDKRTRNIASKVVRLACLDMIEPALPIRIVVDDFEIPTKGAWRYYTPQGFVDAWRSWFKEKGL